MALPTQLPLDRMQTTWKSQIDPILSIPMLSGIQLSNIAIKSGINVINTKLQRTQQGWVITDITSPALISRSQPFNSTTLTLTSSAATTINLWVLMSYTLSPNMNLPVPGVGSEAGPQYATDVNNSLTLIDQHNHSPGSGVQITPAGINISSNLPFNSNFATGVAGLTLSAQSSTPSVNTLYESGVDLYWVDGNGNNIRLTQLGTVAAAPGNITGLAAPATYISSSATFQFQSTTTAAANLDAGSINLRNLSPNSTYALTLSAPAGLSNNYTLQLPTIPSQTSFMQLSNAGIMTATVAPDNNTLEVPAQGITATQIANNTVTNAQLASSVSVGTLTNMIQFSSPGPYNWTVPAGVNYVTVFAVGGGGGGSSGDTVHSGKGGCGSFGAYSIWAVTPSTVIPLVVGSGGAGAAFGGGGGSPGTTTFFNGNPVGPGAAGGSDSSVTTAPLFKEGSTPGGVAGQNGGSSIQGAGGSASQGGGGGAGWTGPGGGNGGSGSTDASPGGGYGAGGGGGGLASAGGAGESGYLAIYY